MMSISKKITGILLSIVVMIMAFTSVSMAAELIPDGNVQLNGSIQWNDNDNSEGLRPDSVIINLYENDSLIGCTTADASGEWKFSFDVDVYVDPDTGKAADYRFEQEIPRKYLEDSHEDPVIESGEIVCGSWKKYTPCNVLQIPASRLSDSIIVGKLSGKYAEMPTAVVWTKAVLSDDEKSQIEGRLSGINGIGNPKNIEFYSGDSVSITKYGVVIHASEGKILMNRPDCWALLSGAEYTKKYTQINNGLLVNALLTRPVAPVIPDQPNDPLAPVDPDTPIQPEDPVGPPDPEIDTPPELEEPAITEKADVNSPENTASVTADPASAYPHTGDDSNAIVWIVLAVLTATAALTIKCRAKR